MKDRREISVVVAVLLACKKMTKKPGYTAQSDFSPAFGRRIIFCLRLHSYGMGAKKGTERMAVEAFAHQ